MRFQIHTFPAAVMALAATLQAKPFTQIIPAEADLILAARDVTELREDWQLHPLAEMVEDPEVRSFFKKLLPEANAGQDDPSLTEVLENEFGLTWDEFFELFPGQVAISLHNLPELLIDREQRPDLAIMAEYSGTAEQLDGLMNIQFERNAEAQRESNPLIEHEMVEERFMGERLYFDEVFDGENSYVEDGYALVDGVFVLATPEERLRSLVESIKAGTEQPMADEPVFLRLREEADAGDLTVFLNLGQVMPPLNEALLEKSSTGGLAMFGVTGQSLQTALALEAMQGFGMDLRLTPEGMMSHSGLVFREKAGLLGFLTYGDGGLPPAPYVPAEILSSTVTNFDLSRMLAHLESFLTMASPSVAPIFDIQLQNIKNQTGVDIRTAVMRNFGPEMVTLSVLPESGPGTNLWMEPEQLFVFRIRDAVALSGALEALKDQIPGARGQMESREFEGETIHIFQPVATPNMPDAPAQSFSYAITRTHLLINVGEVGLLQEVLSAMQNNSEGFWQGPDIEDLYRDISRPGAVARSYFSLQQVVRPTLESIVQASRMAGGSVDTDSIPQSLDFPYELISEMHEAPDGFFSRSVLVRSEDTE